MLKPKIETESCYLILTTYTITKILKLNENQKMKTKSWRRVFKFATIGTLGFFIQRTKIGLEKYIIDHKAEIHKGKKQDWRVTDAYFHLQHLNSLYIETGKQPNMSLSSNVHYTHSTENCNYLHFFRATAAAIPPTTSPTTVAVIPMPITPSVYPIIRFIRLDRSVLIIYW